MSQSREGLSLLDEQAGFMFHSCSTRQEKPGKVEHDTEQENHNKLLNLLFLIVLGMAGFRYFKGLEIC